MPVTNKQISKLFKLTATIMELHEDKPFKARSYENAAFSVRQFGEPLATMTDKELETLQGIGKSIAKKIVQIGQTGSFDELNKLLEITPAGLVELIGIKGLGGKKVKTLWEALGITSPEELMQACLDNRLLKVKGFAKKSQDSIIELLHFYYQSKNKYLYAEAEVEMLEILKYFEAQTSVKRISETGEMRRKMEYVVKIDFLIEPAAGESLDKILQEASEVIVPFEGGYRSAEMDIPVEFTEVTQDTDWFGQLVRTTATPEHLSHLKEETLSTAASEEEIYTKNGFPFIIPEMREGRDEFERAGSININEIITIQDIKGCVHNHSTYSDGANTLAQMAQYCKDMGLQYFGICDHSQTAVYASGLHPGRVLQQIKEIDQLNTEMAPFRIFKGIESDILNDGSLDYDENILQQLDFVVASIHSNLKMKEADAHKRLLKAIENPYTTILGHMTSRQLLVRDGYPIDHKLIIDACAANHVVIEINAAPKRLDMDWRWYTYALDKGIMFSINPDAHSTTELHNMYYGVCVARKGGIPNKRILNALPVSEIESFFNHKKSGTY